MFCCSSQLYYLFSGLVAIFAVYLLKPILWRLSQRLPPGPWGLPLVGYAPFLTNALSTDYYKLQQKYGKTFGFFYGSRYTVVLGNFADIKEAYNKDEFIYRHPTAFTISDDYDNLVNMSGWEWKETRRFTLSTLRNLGMGKNKIEGDIKEQISILMEQIMAREPNSDVNVHEMMYPPLLNISFSLVCGKTFDENVSLLALMEKYSNTVVEILHKNQLRFFYPILKPFLRLKELLFSQSRYGVEEMENFMWKEISAHEKRFDESLQDDFIDYYINTIKKKGESNTSLTRPNINGNAQILLFAGTDTTRETLVWMCLCLAEFQLVQEKVYAEIVDVLGRECTPSWSDRDKLPYLNTFLMEVQRWKTVAAVADPHWSNSDGTVGGAFIPKHSIIYANVYAVHMDKELWGDPESFRPERFMSADETKTVQPEYWIPFLTGKRACPAEKLASMQLFLFVASIVQKFRVLPPSSGLSLDEYENFLRFAVKPFVSFHERN